MAKLTKDEEITLLKRDLKVARALADERGNTIAELNQLVAHIREAERLNFTQFTKQRTDFQKVCLAFDAIRQTVVRSSAALNLDNINPLTVIKSVSAIYNESTPQAGVKV